MTTEIYIHEGEAESIKAAGLAQQLYNLYHGAQATDTRSRLEQNISRLTPAQIEQLTAIAAAMAT